METKIENILKEIRENSSQSGVSIKKTKSRLSRLGTVKKTRYWMKKNELDFVYRKIEELSELLSKESLNLTEPKKQKKKKTVLSWTKSHPRRKMIDGLNISN